MTPKALRLSITLCSVAIFAELLTRHLGILTPVGRGFAFASLMGLVALLHLMKQLRPPTALYLGAMLIFGVSIGLQLWVPSYQDANLKLEVLVRTSLFLASLSMAYWCVIWLK
jgi:hypothetical protein